MTVLDESSRQYDLPLPPTLTPARLTELATHAVSNPEGKTISTTAPYTGAPLGDLPLATEETVEDAFGRAKNAQAGWADTPISERKKIMLRFHDLVLARQAEALDLMQAENGKTRRDAFLEIADTAITARYYACNAERFLRPVRRRGAVPVLTRTTELHHPKGIVTIISPWNYPLSMAAGDAVPALMAGNVVVQKPDTQTALTALWALGLMREAGLPADVWQMVVGHGSEIGDTLLDGADFVMFTGSTASGRRIASGAGERLIRAALELGGKNPMIVLDDADLDRTIAGAVAGCFPSGGQLCVSIERIYAPDARFDEFVDRFAAATRALTIGAAYDYSMEMGSLTTPSQLKTVTEHVDDAVSKGAKVVVGGAARPDLGPLFYEPTILTGVTPDMTLCRHETFGPVVSVYPYKDVEGAIEMANDSPYGLNASVWGRNGMRARAVAARVHAGSVNVNEAFAATWGSIDAPMGGVGDSGLGRRHGSDGILKYTEAQTIAQQRLHNLGLPTGSPAQPWTRTVTRGLKLLRAFTAR